MKTEREGERIVKFAKRLHLHMIRINMFCCDRKISLLDPALPSDADSWQCLSYQSHCYLSSLHFAFLHMPSITDQHIDFKLYFYHKYFPLFPNFIICWSNMFFFVALLPLFFVFFFLIFFPTFFSLNLVLFFNILLDVIEVRYIKKWIVNG